MTWDGGNDSGWVAFSIEGNLTEEDKSFIEYLREKCYNELDYGSWAGEFSANGEATFDPKESSFIGTDYYTEEENVTRECGLKIAIPKSIWFDAVEIAIEDIEVTVRTSLVVRNGFKTSTHEQIETSISASITEQVLFIIDQYESDDGYNMPFRSIWENIRLSKADFKEEGDELVHIITALTIGVDNESEKEIFIQLKEEE